METKRVKAVAPYQQADLAMDTMASELPNRAVWGRHPFLVAEGVAQEIQVVFLDLDGENETRQAKAALAVPACKAAEAVLRRNLVLSAKSTHEGPSWKTEDLVHVKDPFEPAQVPAKLIGGLASALPVHEKLRNADLMGRQVLVYRH